MNVLEIQLMTTFNIITKKKYYNRSTNKQIVIDHIYFVNVVNPVPLKLRIF
jgi:hypothetical protein